MSKLQKKLIGFSAAIALVSTAIPSASAMHIMEGYLPRDHSIIWGALALPFILAGIFSLKKKLSANPRAIMLLAISAAFIFVVSALKIPSVTGSCSHMVGTGVGAILFGPLAASVLGVIVLIFQSLMLAHGGLTTLGANAFAMAIAAPFLTFSIYALCKKLKISGKITLFLAVFSGSVVAYSITAAQLALAYPSSEGGFTASLAGFVTIFTLTQIPLAIIEGLLSVMVFSIIEIYAKDHLIQLNYTISAKPHTLKNTVIVCTAAALIIAITPVIVLRDADFEGADTEGSSLIEEIYEETHDRQFEPWADSPVELLFGEEIPAEIESLLFCLQTGLGVGVIAFSLGRLNERKKKEEDQNSD
jgi:cobalt/nickel transport system permease protein